MPKPCLWLKATVWLRCHLGRSWQEDGVRFPPCCLDNCSGKVFFCFAPLPAAASPRLCPAPGDVPLCFFIANQGKNASPDFWKSDFLKISLPRTVASAGANPVFPSAAPRTRGHHPRHTLHPLTLHPRLCSQRRLVQLIPSFLPEGPGVEGRKIYPMDAAGNSAMEERGAGHRPLLARLELSYSHLASLEPCPTGTGQHGAKLRWVEVLWGTSGEDGWPGGHTEVSLSPKPQSRAWSGEASSCTAQGGGRKRTPRCRALLASPPLSTIPSPISGPIWLPAPQTAPGCCSPAPGHPNMRGGGGGRAGAGGHG